MPSVSSSATQLEHNYSREVDGGIRESRKINILEGLY